MFQFFTKKKSTQRKEATRLHKLVIAVVTSIVLTSSLTAGEPGPAKDVPELIPLNHWAGTWNSRIEKPSPRTGESRGEWIVAGRYLQVRWQLDGDAASPASSGSYIMTYDSKQKAYRQWHFNSDGFTGEATGQWDAATKTMTWTASNQPNRTTINKDHFPAADIRHFAMTITDPTGKRVFEMNGQSQRQKD